MGFDVCNHGVQEGGQSIKAGAEYGDKRRCFHYYSPSPGNSDVHVFMRVAGITEKMRFVFIAYTVQSTGRPREPKASRDLPSQRARFDVDLTLSRGIANDSVFLCVAL